MPKAVDLKIETRIIPTYQLGADSSLPQLGELQREELYPYSLQSDISTESKPISHKIIVIENEYLRAEILPDLGGRIYRLFDKIAGKDAFEFQSSIKPQIVAARGAWFSGGIEFNYGFHGHTVNTYAPVSWSIQNEQDGSASVWVGSLIMPIESRWSLRMSLKPGRAILDNEIHITSPQALPALMYWWSNSGVQVSEQSEFFYFGPAGTSGHVRHSWPFAEGLDLRWWKNRVNQGDMFLLQCQRNAMGFYDHGRNHGIACTADRFDAPGEKYFTWGTDTHGRAFDKMLSDEEHTYCEVQRGRNYSQVDSDFITSMTEDVWTESWMPLRNMSGFSDDCRELAMHVIQNDDSAILNIQAHENLKDLIIEVFCNNTSIQKLTVADLTPKSLFSKNYTTPNKQQLDHVLIKTKNNITILDWKKYTPNSEDWIKTGRYDALEGIDTVDKLFAEAQSLRFQTWPRQDKKAMKLYNTIISIDPGHVETLLALAEVDFFRGLYEDALAKIEKALPRAHNHPHLLALKGWSLLRTDQLEDALEAFGWAGRNEPHRRRGLFGAALVLLKQGNSVAANNAAERILTANPTDKWGRLIQVIVARKHSNFEKATSILKELLKVDPLWNLLHAEAKLLNIEINLAAGTRQIADDSVSAANLYLDLNWWAEAETILKINESNEPFSPADRLAHLLFVQNQLGKAEEAIVTLKSLQNTTTIQANPWTTKSITILKFLTELYPSEGMIHFLLGNILSNRNRQAEAISAWKMAEQCKLNSPVLFANLAAVAKNKNEFILAKNYYEKALALVPSDLSIWLPYDRLLATMGLREARANSFNNLPENLKNRTQPILRHVEQLLDNCLYKEAAAELTTKTIARGENDGTVLLLHFESIIGQTVKMIENKKFDEAITILKDALIYPENIGMGKMNSNPSEAIIHYFLGLVSDMAGQKEAARKHWETAATEPSSMPSIACSYIILANNAIGRKQTARNLSIEMEKYIQGKNSLPHHHHYYHSSGRLDLQYGLLNLARKKIDTAISIWQNGLADYPDTRMLRLHFNFPPELINRISSY